MSHDEIEQRLQDMKEYLVRKVHEFIEYEGERILSHFTDVMRRHLEGLEAAAAEYAERVADRYTQDMEMK